MSACCRQNSKMDFQDFQLRSLEPLVYPSKWFPCLWDLSFHIISQTAIVIPIHKLICIISLPKILHWFPVTQRIKSKFFSLAYKDSLAPVHSYILLSQNTDIHTYTSCMRTYICTSSCLHTLSLLIEQIVTSLPQTIYSLHNTYFIVFHRVGVQLTYCL